MLSVSHPCARHEGLWVRWDMARLIFNIDRRWKSMVSFTPRPMYPSVKELATPFNRLTPYRASRYDWQICRLCRLSYWDSPFLQDLEISGVVIMYQLGLRGEKYFLNTLKIPPTPLKTILPQNWETLGDEEIMIIRNVGDVSVGSTTSYPRRTDFSNIYIYIYVFF